MMPVSPLRQVSAGGPNNINQNNRRSATDTGNMKLVPLEKITTSKVNYPPVCRTSHNVYIMTVVTLQWSFSPVTRFLHSAIESQR